MNPNPFGEDRTLRSRARILALNRQRAPNEVTASGSPRAVRIGRRAGTWAAQTRLRRFAPLIVVAYDLAATVTRPTRDLAAKLKQSRAANAVWFALVLIVFVGSIIYGLVTGEGNGPG